MKPLILIILIASSVYAAPPVVVNQFTENEVPRSSNLIENAMNFAEGGDTNVGILTVQQIIVDLADQTDRVSQSLAIGQTLGILIELSTGIPGDTCTAAALIDAYANAVRSGKFAGVRGALVKFIRQFANDLKLIVKLATDPSTAKYAVGPRGGCVGGGRSYQFEAAWDAILARANPYSYGLINEEYCAAKRLYYAFNSRSNNVGAEITALALPPVVEILVEIRESAIAFLKALVNGHDPSAALARTEQLLLHGLSRVKL